MRWALSLITLIGMSTLNTPFVELNRAYESYREEQKKASPGRIETLSEVVEILIRIVCKLRTQTYLYSDFSSSDLNLSLLALYSPYGQEQARPGTWGYYARLLGGVIAKNGETPRTIDPLLTLSIKLTGLSDRGTDQRETSEYERILLEEMKKHGFFQMTLRKETEKGTVFPGSTEPRETVFLCSGTKSLPVSPLFVTDGESLLVEKRASGEEGRDSLIYDGEIEKINRDYPRFQAEIQGDFHESLENFLREYRRSDYKLYPEVRGKLQKLVEEGRPFIKVIGRPLTGKSSLTAHIDSYIPGARPFRIDYGFLSHDAGVFEAFVRREIEKSLGTPGSSGTFGHPGEPGGPGEHGPPRKEDSLSSLVKELGKKKKRLVIAVDNAQLLVLLRPGSHRKILDLMKEWDLPQQDGSPLVFILVTRYASAEDLPGPPVQIPDSYSHIRSQPEKKEALLKIIAEKDRLADPLIAALLAELEPVPLWRLSEKVEESWGQPVFIPILKMSLETVLADLILKNERGWYAIWEQLRN